MKKTAVAWLAAVAAIAVGYNASASIVQMDLDYVLTGGPIQVPGAAAGDTTTIATGNTASQPWVVAKFEDKADGVYLTLTGPGLGGGDKLSNPQHVGADNKGSTTANSEGWFFNVADTYAGTLTIGEQSRAGFFLDPVIVQHTDFFNPGGLGSMYDLNIMFQEDDAVGAPNEFTVGDSVTYKITSSVTGLTAASFAVKSTGTGGQYSAAWIENGANGWASTASLVPPPPVPEPTTMIAGALLLLPFGASTLRILRRNRAA